MKNIFNKIKKCRISDDKNLVDVAKIGPLTLTGTFLKKKYEKIHKTPLDLVFSKKSCLLQLKHNYKQELLFGENYGYRSSLNKSMEEHLNKKSKVISKLLRLNKGDKILDIGSNDGTFLNSFSKKIQKYGIDPTARKFKKYYHKDIVVKTSLFDSNIKLKTKFKLISSIAMFYDLADPKKFCNLVSNYLEPDGIFHIEVAYLPDILSKFSFDTFCQEHLTYFSFKSFKFLIDQTPFKIIDFSRNSINGGSINFNLALKNSKWKINKKKITKIINFEKKLKLDRKETYIKYFKEIEKNSNLIKKFIKNLKTKNKKISAFGASTKGNVILQYANIDNKIIDSIYDVNPYKFGKFTPGTNIIIKNENQIFLDKPDYLLILIWHFKKTLKIKFKKFKKINLRYILPFPKLKLIKI